jgi:hypothetical protein
MKQARFLLAAFGSGTENMAVLIVMMFTASSAPRAQGF